MSGVHSIRRFYPPKKPFLLIMMGSSAQRNKATTCPLSFLSLPRPSLPPLLPTHPSKSKTAPGPSHVPRVQGAERRAAGERLLLCPVKSMRDHRWTWRVLRQARRGKGHGGWSVWRLKFHDNTDSSEFTGLQEIPLRIWGDHLGCMFLLLASDCLGADVLNLRNG